MNVAGTLARNLAEIRRLEGLRDGQFGKGQEDYYNRQIAGIKTENARLDPSQRSPQETLYEYTSRTEKAHLDPSQRSPKETLYEYVSRTDSPMSASTVPGRPDRRMHAHLTWRVPTLTDAEYAAIVDALDVALRDPRIQQDYPGMENLREKIRAGSRSSGG